MSRANAKAARRLDRAVAKVTGLTEKRLWELECVSQPIRLMYRGIRLADGSTTTPMLIHSNFEHYVALQAHHAKMRDMLDRLSCRPNEIPF